MKAQVVHEIGGVENLRYETVEAPILPPGHVRIGVKAVGVNVPDLLIIQGRYGLQPDLPFSPGVEAAGVVLEVAEGVKAVEPGDRVVGFSHHGAMAEQFVVPEYAAFRIADDLPFVKAAAASMTYGTSYHALVNRAGLHSGETLLVTGAAGGVGTAAIQVGKALGARVIAAVGNEEKARVSDAMGADEIVVYTIENLEDRVRDLTDGHGADVVFEPVGGEVFHQALGCAAWEARVLVVGFASGEVPETSTGVLSQRAMSLVGVSWPDFVRRDPARNRDNFEQLLSWMSDGRLDPYVTATFDLEHAPDALEALSARGSIGKLVLTVDAA